MSTKNMTQEEIDRKDLRVARHGMKPGLIEKRRLRVKNRKHKRELDRREAQWIAEQEAKITAEKAEKARLRRISRLKPSVRAKKVVQKSSSKPSETKKSTKVSTSKKR